MRAVLSEQSQPAERKHKKKPGTFWASWRGKGSGFYAAFFRERLRSGFGKSDAGTCNAPSGRCHGSESFSVL